MEMKQGDVVRFDPLCYQGTINYLGVLSPGYSYGIYYGCSHKNGNHIVFLGDEFNGNIGAPEALSGRIEDFQNGHWHFICDSVPMRLVTQEEIESMLPETAKLLHFDILRRTPKKRRILEELI